MTDAPASVEADGDRDAAGLGDAGPVRNTFLQFVSQIAGAVFTAGLTLFLVRALGPGGYGVYALAVSIGALILFPAMFGLPMSIGRFLADHRGDIDEVRSILRLGLKLQLPTAAAASAALFLASGAVAHLYGDPRLTWPLRWVAVAVLGQALFNLLTSAATSVRRVALNVWTAVIESATETTAAIVLVLAGAGAAGATLGKAIGYGVATAASLYLTIRLVGGARLRTATPRRISLRTITRYAGAMFVVDVTWSAIGQVDVLLIGALLSSEAVGKFSAVLRIVTVLGYLGTAVSAGVAPRLSLGGGAPDTRGFSQAIRYLLIVQGLVIAPMVVWSEPIVRLLLGPGYGSSAEVMQLLAVYAFVSAPASLISVAVTYLGEARRRVVIMLGTLGLGLLCTYILVRTVGLAGAAIADDLVQVVYLAANVWLCSRLITMDLRRLTVSGIRTLVAAGAMALTLFAFGTDHLSVAQWLVGGSLAMVAYAVALLATRELTISELRVVVELMRRRSGSAAA